MAEEDRKMKTIMMVLGLLTYSQFSLAAGDPRLECKVLMTTPGGGKLDTEYSGVRSGNDLAINAGATFPDMSVSIRISADLRLNRYGVYIFDVRTRKRILISEGPFVMREDIFAGADHGPRNGMDSINVSCTIF